LPVLATALIAYYPLRRSASALHARHRATSSARDLVRKQRELILELEKAKDQPASKAGGDSTDEVAHELAEKSASLKIEAAEIRESLTKMSPARRFLSTRPRSHLFVAQGLMSIALLALLLWVPAWPGSWLAMIPMFLAGYFAGYFTESIIERTGRLSTVLALVGPLLVVYAISAGLTGLVAGVSTGEYHFARPLPNLSQGSYTRLGQNGDMIFLRACRGDYKSVMTVHQGEILTTRLEARHTPDYPSLWQVWRHNKDPAIGLKSC
jgi:hypothetical protein